MRRTCDFWGVVENSERWSSSQASLRQFSSCKGIKHKGVPPWRCGKVQNTSEPSRLYPGIPCSASPKQTRGRTREHPLSFVATTPVALRWVSADLSRKRARWWWTGRASTIAMCNLNKSESPARSPIPSTTVHLLFVMSGGARTSRMHHTTLCRSHITSSPTHSHRTSQK